MNSPEDLSAELNLWYRRISRVEKIPMANRCYEWVQNVPRQCITKYKNSTAFIGNITFTTCEGERTFSTVRRLKTYLRNTMGETRLNGLAMLNIHREYTPSAEDILNELIKKSRRLDLKLA